METPKGSSLLFYNPILKRLKVFVVKTLVDSYWIQKNGVLKRVHGLMKMKIWCLSNEQMEPHPARYTLNILNDVGCGHLISDRNTFQTVVRSYTWELDASGSMQR